MSAKTYPSAFSPEQEGEASSLASRRGVAILILLSLVQFMDVLDASILNIALPSIKMISASASKASVGDQRLHPRLRRLPAPRRPDGRPAHSHFMLVTGLVVFASSSLTGGLAPAARCSSGAAQGIGAAMLSPAALSSLTSTAHP
jgi:hypothetical protein